MVRAAPGAEKGPDARRRPKAAGEAYSCTLSPRPRAPQHASHYMTQMGLLGGLLDPQESDYLHGGREVACAVGDDAGPEASRPLVRHRPEDAAPEDRRESHYTVTVRDGEDGRREPGRRGYAEA